MIDPLALIHRYYQPGSDIERVLRLHSEDVTGLALELLDAHPEMNLDRTFVAEAAMLHDRPRLPTSTAQARRPTSYTASSGQNSYVASAYHAMRT